MKQHEKLYSFIKNLTDAIKNGTSEHESRMQLIKFLKCSPKTSSPELLKLAEIRYEELVS